MGTLPKNKWLAASLLAIILPLGLLTTFKLAGIINEPQTPEKFFGKVVILNLTRPSDYVDLYYYLIPSESHYTDDDVAIQMSLSVSSYYQLHYMGFAFAGSGVEFLTSVNVSAFQGFPVSMKISYNTDINSALFIETQWLEEQNVTAIMITNPYYAPGAESNISAKIGTPSYVKVQAFWAFSNLTNVSRQLDVSLEILTFNGTDYRKIILPMRVYMWLDPGSSFEEALPIDVGTYTGWLGICISSPGFGFDDFEDYYRLWVEKDQTINVHIDHQMSNDGSTDLDLYLYDPSENLATYSCSKPPETTESITWTASTPGWCYIRVSRESFSGGLYTLEVTL